RRHTRSKRDWSSDVCSSDLGAARRPGETSLTSLLVEGPTLPEQLEPDPGAVVQGDHVERRAPGTGQLLGAHRAPCALQEVVLVLPPGHRDRCIVAPGPAGTQSGEREARVSPVPLGCGGVPEPVQRPGQPGVQAWAQQRSGQFVAEGTDLIRGDVPRGVREYEMRVVARMAQDPLLDLLASCRRRLLEILLEHIIGGPA